MLNTPIVRKIPAFDPHESYSVVFQYEGNQAVKNRAVIIDNETYQTVYDHEQERMRLDHVIVANTLSPGKAYQIKIKVYDDYGNESDFSSPVLFYCFTKPTFKFSNLTNDMIHRTAVLPVKLSYSQSEGETFRECQISLYTYDYVLSTSSNILYDVSNLSHTFYGLKNESVYYLRATGKTTHDMDIDTGYLKVNIQYIMKYSNVILRVKNLPEIGSISLSSNIIDIGYEFENDNWYIKDGELVIYDNSLTYLSGFSAPSEYTVFCKARKIIPNVPFLTLKTPDGKKSVWLEIQKIGTLYYCVLNAPYGLGTYNIYKELPKAVLVNDAGEILTDTTNRAFMIVNLDYTDGYTTVFEVRFRKGLFGLQVYYEEDSTVEEVVEE